MKKNMQKYKTDFTTQLSWVALTLDLMVQSLTKTLRWKLFLLAFIWTSSSLFKLFFLYLKIINWASVSLQTCDIKIIFSFKPDLLKRPCCTIVSISAEWVQKPLSQMKLSLLQRRFLLELTHLWQNYRTWRIVQIIFTPLWQIEKISHHSAQQSQHHHYHHRNLWIIQTVLLLRKWLFVLFLDNGNRLMTRMIVGFISMIICSLIW